MMRWPASLTSRLVVTVVMLVLAVSALIATATALAMDSYLTSRLDDQIDSSLARASRGGPAPPGSPRGGAIDPSNQAPGTLIAILGERPSGLVLTQTIGGDRELSTAALDVLSEVPDDGSVQEVDLPSFGTYRVAATTDASGTTRVTGLPTAGVDDAMASLVRWQILLTVLGVAAATGAGLFLVRRQLRPLREVADTAHVVSELPLAEGEIDLTERVPEHLTDADTEVGQVGAALNTLLAHVESSLSARQRSEQQVRQFVADSSHELRTPLATIKGYAELARSRPEDIDGMRTALDKVGSESVRMTALVEDLLLLARLDAGRPIEQLPVDLTRLLLEAVSDARVLGPDHVWRLDLPAESVEIIGDEQRLHQVVTNLLTNARRHTPPGTTVTVTLLAAAAGPRVDDRWSTISRPVNRRSRSSCTTTVRASPPTWSARRSSGSLVPTRRALAAPRQAPVWDSPWWTPSSRHTGARWVSSPGPVTRRSESGCPTGSQGTDRSGPRCS